MDGVVVACAAGGGDGLGRTKGPQPKVGSGNVCWLLKLLSAHRVGRAAATPPHSPLQRGCWPRQTPLCSRGGRPSGGGAGESAVQPPVTAVPPSAAMFDQWVNAACRLQRLTGPLPTLLRQCCDADAELGLTDNTSGPSRAKCGWWRASSSVLSAAISKALRIAQCRHKATTYRFLLGPFLLRPIFSTASGMARHCVKLAIGRC